VSADEVQDHPKSGGDRKRREPDPDEQAQRRGDLDHPEPDHFDAG
jgi:hypothetical protein